MTSLIFAPVVLLAVAVVLTNIGLFDVTRKVWRLHDRARHEFERHADRADREKDADACIQALRVRVTRQEQRIVELETRLAAREPYARQAD
ncbi:MAG: hypothetical protein FWD62_01660 [Betaproteobacteria bacterium]|nr:hypothetical protein [Betaproteobacteria bacterium]